MENHLPSQDSGALLTRNREVEPLAVNMTATDELKWFAVYTIARHEKRIAEYFQIRGLDHFLPTYRTIHRWKDRTKARIELPLFPGYVFVHISRFERASVLRAPGVLSIVGSRREPTPLPEFEIESLRNSAGKVHLEPHPYLSVGSRVRIKSGPLAGMEGVLVRRQSSLRVVLTLDLVMQSVMAEVNPADLLPIS